MASCCRVRHVDSRSGAVERRRLPCEPLGVTLRPTQGGDDGDARIDDLLDHGRQLAGRIGIGTVPEHHIQQRDSHGLVTCGFRQTIEAHRLVDHGMGSASGVAVVPVVDEGVPRRPFVRAHGCAEGAFHDEPGVIAQGSAREETTNRARSMIGPGRGPRRIRSGLAAQHCQNLTGAVLERRVAHEDDDHRRVAGSCGVTHLRSNRLCRSFGDHHDHVRCRIRIEGTHRLFRGTSPDLAG